MLKLAVNLSGQGQEIMQKKGVGSLSTAVPTENWCCGSPPSLARSPFLLVDDSCAGNCSTNGHNAESIREGSDGT